ncbi:DNA-3-methyladenine glycosylase 2 family protein [Neiella sp. HB171785]|uniref:DNA-3-methyladenine glycosylase 2 family protein n=1 Tax=Neiella litorisoli TaxID=2771431 RepID=A0A8J6QVH9_9GAMM|nr:DNA-3-methyladenine glycosylase 2 [Neiella litorisoli]MBD1391357.1 DNA-3-methyladenine glycosylase 2 family protein [Neiella litorisoli]
MSLTEPTLSPEQCRTARLARDARFDGQFFVAVKTTGIFCRPICPATPPKESNVSYLVHATQAMQLGYRPCLRCRPDAAPNSWAWRGVETTVKRAVELMDQGALQRQNLSQLSERLGVTDRHLRQLFQRFIGMSPKQYDSHRRLLLAKQLLHETQLPMVHVALASGFSSLRRFNDAFVKTLRLQPNQIRRQQQSSTVANPTLLLSYRPPFDWPRMLAFYRARAIDGLEHVDEHSYRRTFTIDGQTGWFEVCHHASKHALALTVEIDALSVLPALIQHVRRLFDLDANSSVIDHHLQQTGLATGFIAGVRLPGIWNLFEAGVRAILGQQVSVKAARNLVQQVVTELGQPLNATLANEPQLARCFPTPKAIAASDLMFLKMPESRRQCLKRLAQYFLTEPDCSPDDWLALKGIGPWTVNYAKLRGLSEPNIYLNSDLGVKNALKAQQLELIPEQLSPWGSYATFQLWSRL